LAGAEVRFGVAQSRFDQVDVVMRRSGTLFRLLLEGVQHVYDALETHGVDRPVRIGVEIIDQFEDGTPAKSLQRLRRLRFVAVLNLPQRITDPVLNLRRESLQVLQAGANEDTGFRVWSIIAYNEIIGKSL
jgi:hypothetical protein